MDTTKYVEPEKFPGSIAPFAGNKEDGAKAAKKHADGGDEISFRRDSSIMDTGCK